MSLITLQDITLSFVRRDLFSHVGLQVETGERIGLVGPNGSGKTTLLKLIVGEAQADHGEIRIARGVRIGYLPQEFQEDLASPLLKSVADAAPGRLALRLRLRELEAAMAGASGAEEQARLGRELSELHLRAQALDTEFPTHEAEKILAGLGFSPSRFEDPLDILSGGWRTRALLARLLYQRPDILLLDEPTNHLDIPSIRWFEDYLKGFKGALVLISHDSDFLDRQVRRIVSFEPEGMRTYTGNYTAYRKAREEEERLLEAKARRQEQRIKEAQRFIDRFKAKASKARQAQSKIKLVKKMELVETARKEKTLRFSFPPVPGSGRDVLMLEGVEKTFGGTPLYRDVTLHVRRGERIAVIGSNGAGKTTLLRMVAGEFLPDRGRILQGQGVVLGYYAQHHTEMLTPEHTVVEAVHAVVPGEGFPFVRGVCGAFLFSGADVDKPVSVLSGGEKARVALARLLVNPGNLMVMDEPTNHLDIASAEALIEALDGYGGTLLFVSHNQAFIKRLATRIWDIREGRIDDYPGTLEAYYDHLERTPVEGRGQGAPGDRIREEAAPVASTKDRKEDKRLRAERRREIQEALSPLTRRVADLETRIEVLERRKRELETSLADPALFKDNERGVPLIKEYHRIGEEMPLLYAEWEGHQAMLEETRRQYGM